MKIDIPIYRRVRHLDKDGRCFATEHCLFGGAVELDIAPDLGGLPGEAARHYFMRTYGLFVGRWYFSLDILIFPFFKRARRSPNGDVVYFD